MFSALTSYLWGTEEENNTEKPITQIKDQIELEGDWIYTFFLPTVPLERIFILFLNICLDTC